MKNVILTGLFGLSLIINGCGKKSVEDYSREAMEAMNEGDFATAYMVVDVMENIYPRNKPGNTYLKAAETLNQKIASNEISALFEDSEDPLLLSKIKKIVNERFPGNKDGKKDVLNLAFNISLDAKRYDVAEDLLLEKTSVKEDYIKFITVLLNSDYEKKNDKIVQVLSSYRIEGERKEGLVGYSDGGWYITSCGDYNSICDNALELAISRGDYSLASSIINLYKEDGKKTEGGHWYDSEGKYHDAKKINGVDVDGNHSYIQYNWNSKTAAQKKLNEAKRKK